MSDVEPLVPQEDSRKSRRTSNRPDECLAVVYYLFFATHKEVATKIANDIFKKYR